MIVLAALASAAYSPLIGTRAAARARHPLVHLGEPAPDIVELLSIFRSLPLDGREAVPPSPPTPFMSGEIRPPASSLSLASTRRRARSLLASSDSALRKQDALAALSERARLSGRVHSAQLAYDLAAHRVEKWRASKGDVVISRRLIEAGALAAVARRDQRAYEQVLLRAQEEWGVELSCEPALLSALLAGCSEAGWRVPARAANLTLDAAALAPTTRALNSLMAACVDAWDDGNGAIDTYLTMRRTRSVAADRRSHALATRAAAARKTSWPALRNLMRRSWLKIPWVSETANAALEAFLERGSARQGHSPRVEGQGPPGRT